MTRSARVALALLLVASAGLPGCGSSDGPTNSCVAAGTLVATPRGCVPVEAIRVGDAVLSVDHATGRSYPARVAAVRSARRPCLELTTAAGNSVIASAEHPFLSPETRAYEPLSRWAEGELRQVYRHDGSPVPERVVRCAPLPGERTVFDLTVDSADHNFVAGGFVVHNKSEVPPALDVSGTWHGEWTSDDVVSGTFIAMLTSSKYTTTGTLELGAPCDETAEVEGTAYVGARTIDPGHFSAMVKGEDFALRFEGLVREGTVAGSYHFAGGASCLGPRGTFTMSQVASPARAELLPRTVWLVLDEAGEVRAVGETVGVPR